MDAPITRAEHGEFRKAMEAENKRLADEDGRQNKRLEILEANVNQIIVQQLTGLTATIEKLDMGMGNILREQAEIGERLRRLEGRDGERWRQVTGYAITTLVSLIIGYFFAQLGM